MSETPESYYPTILLLHGELGPTSTWHGSMTTIVVNPRLNKWASRTDIFPQREEKILKIVPSTGGAQHGWYILYELKSRGQGIWWTFAQQNTTSNGLESFEPSEIIQPTYRR